jgi:hypothetical protein
MSSVTSRYGLYLPAGTDLMRASPELFANWQTIDARVIPELVPNKANLPIAPIVDQRCFIHDTQRLVLWNGSNWDILTNKPRASIRKTSSQVITTVTQTALDWDTIDNDNDGMTALISQPERITIQTPGIYLFMASIAWEAGTTALMRISFEHSDGSIKQSNGIGTIGSTTQQNWCSVIQEMAVGNWMRVMVTHNQGTNKSVVFNGSAPTTFSAQYMRGSE